MKLHEILAGIKYNKLNHFDNYRRSVSEKPQRKKKLYASNNKVIKYKFHSLRTLSNQIKLTPISLTVFISINLLAVIHNCI